MRTRTGKIARLPLAVREQLNLRLLENETAAKILPWLNGLPETLAVLAEMPDPNAPGKMVHAIDDRNLSDWRLGGFADWRRRRDHLVATRELAAWSVKMASAAGGDLAEGAAAMLAGQLTEMMETLCASGEEGADPAERGKAIDAAARAIASVRAGDHARQKLALERERQEQDKREFVLEEKKFQRTTCELFAKYCEDQAAVAAATGGGDNSEKIERLGQIMFGEGWQK